LPLAHRYQIGSLYTTPHSNPVLLSLSTAPESTKMSATAQEQETGITVTALKPLSATQTLIENWSATVDGPPDIAPEAIFKLFPGATDRKTDELVVDTEFDSIGPKGSVIRRPILGDYSGIGVEAFDTEADGQMVPLKLGEPYSIGRLSISSPPISPLLSPVVTPPISPVLSPIGTPPITEQVTTITTTTRESRLMPADLVPVSPSISRAYTPPLTPPDSPPLLSPPLTQTTGVYSPPLTSARDPVLVSPPVVSPPLLSPIYSPPATSSVRNTSTYPTGIVSPPPGREVRSNYFA